ncbi:bifunctional acetate--CoA ligase family protein/GNAT family N-acetyltransferase [Thioalbus denitrificans]|uniref:Acetyltransferase n=1 Tax=Thioalbus denitrificans TaxID=547122 RepID=A0A369CH25_9GAMM|nr:bifunctional acetate--CoA ligase family protein/GNAT family N-acetyltransferase [Thioalbus denitrificans]RCX33380.1 acetyltransferase [Thioalbus denitrificans]
MSVRNLDSLFKPRSVAVIGASTREHSIGNLVMQNLLMGGFKGPVMPVNPKYEAVSGVLAYPDVAALPLAPDLAIIATPDHTVPALIGELGVRGTRAAVVLSAGMAQHRDEQGRTLSQAALEAARPHGLRILGPNCLGMLVPGVGLNASFAHVQPPPGKVAFVSQSGALCTAVLDWSQAHNIGFSHFISLGDAADVDFGDVLDYLASDPSTRAILLYIESVRDARKFISAARAAARNKPVLAIKSGRVPEGARAAASHTGALAGADHVYDAALQRAGMLRVYTVAELFDAVETLARMQPLKGDRLAILTNGGGPGVMATDALITMGGRMAELSQETLQSLDELLPETWSHGNPVDIIGDAPPERFREATRILLQDPNVDALLVMHVPTAVAAGEESARAVAQVVRGSRRNVLTSWLGHNTAEKARRLFARAGIPTYETPDMAVRAFMHMVRYKRNQELLMETPPSIPEGFTPDTETAQHIIRDALDAGRTVLTEPEAKEVLAAYGVPIVDTRIAKNVDEAVTIAEAIGFPVALKVLNHEIVHKSDVGGVVLDLDTPGEVRKAAEGMIKRVRELYPELAIAFTVQNMARRPGAHEVIIGATDDSIFGPVVLFGHGGVAVEVIGDRAVALPPLNMGLAGELISRTRISKLLEGYRGRSAADLDAVKMTIIKVSQLITDLPEVVELDINPLFADHQGVLALDARMRIAPATVTGAARLAIRPYPQELEECTTLRSGRQVTLRPIRPEDEPAHYAFFGQLTPEDIYFRFFRSIRSLPHTEMARLTQIDYDREMAFIATATDANGKPETLGVVRTITDPDNQSAEFGIMVRSDQKGEGLGHSLLEKMVRYCRERGTGEIMAQVLPQNRAMLNLSRRLGFRTRYNEAEEVVEVVLPLNPPRE